MFVAQGKSRRSIAGQDGSRKLSFKPKLKINIDPTLNLEQEDRLDESPVSVSLFSTLLPCHMQHRALACIRTLMSYAASTNQIVCLTAIILSFIICSEQVDRSLFPPSHPVAGRPFVLFSPPVTFLPSPGGMFCSFVGSHKNPLLSSLHFPFFFFFLSFSSKPQASL